MIKTIINNRYRIIKELGYGGFGTTYLAEDNQNYALCAVKKLNPQVADFKTAEKLFKREADTLIRLQHVAQVPKFIDYFKTDGYVYIVEEYIEGTSLEDAIYHHWNIENIVIFLWDILSILQLLHEKNIVHRDIKPSNLIQRQKDYKFTIIDFGAVKEIDPHRPQEIGTCIYHQGYAPIEQIQGRPQFNSDIHALGMTAIELLTKEPPREIIRDANDRVIAPDSSVAPTWLIDILNKMVRSDRIERYQSVEEVLKDLGERNTSRSPINTHADRLELTNIITKNNVGNASKTILASWSKSKQKWHVPLALILLLAVSSELINPWLRPRYYISRGNSLLDSNRAQASLSKFQKAIALNRESAAAWKGRGDALFTLRRYKGASNAYDKAIAADFDNIKALNNKAKILYQQREFKQAIEVHQQVIDLDPENANAWSGRGLAYLGMQEFEKALAAFDRAQEIRPEDPAIWLQKGIALHSLQRHSEANMFYQEALAVYNELVAEENKDPLIWTDRGFVLLQLNRPQEAFASYNKALIYNPNFYEALLGKANVLNTMQDFETALQVLDRAKEIRPNDYQVWYNRGNILLQTLNQPELAFNSYQQATQTNPNFYPAWLGQGLASINTQQYSQALKSLDTAKNINPQDPIVWLNRGIALEKLGELEQAIASYEKAAIELQFAPAQEPLKQLQQKM